MFVSEADFGVSIIFIGLVLIALGVYVELFSSDISRLLKFVYAGLFTIALGAGWYLKAEGYF